MNCCINIPGMLQLTAPLLMLSNSTLINATIYLYVIACFPTQLTRTKYKLLMYDEEF